MRSKKKRKWMYGNMVNNTIISSKYYKYIFLEPR